LKRFYSLCPTFMTGRPSYDSTVHLLRKGLGKLAETLPTFPSPGGDTVPTKASPTEVKNAIRHSDS